ncbi:hypothetical protein DPMN_180192 [Dreissena polymorpha]|uniref:Uncharacterized protein n=1 Tax=Dreissena polymorpha TaxID=45954 RepID=A0A9D4EEA3_DREPO|nr:hypothetical protein DPMN_180192 [Dreissena polymorpha]
MSLKLSNFSWRNFSPQFVRERLLCHAIIGRQGGKELIMKIDVSSDFISPLLEFSTKSVYFRVDKVCGFVHSHQSRKYCTVLGTISGKVSNFMVILHF